MTRGQSSHASTAYAVWCIGWGVQSPLVFLSLFSSPPAVKGCSEQPLASLASESPQTGARQGAKAPCRQRMLSYKPCGVRHGHTPLIKGRCPPISLVVSLFLWGFLVSAMGNKPSKTINPAYPLGCLLEALKPQALMPYLQIPTLIHLCLKEMASLHWLL